ncbi:hypothetical protein [Alkalihalobacillus deserti]|uniref:hypothetical protein n=1 Tax=Alkalihalobacillus deserti TaxID=2879466 RepID=UPI001D159532|nr:hypothetical protein [Alkalihalobacillus deserti]
MVKRNIIVFLQFSLMVITIAAIVACSNKQYDIKSATDQHQLNLSNNGGIPNQIAGLKNDIAGNKADIQANKYAIKANKAAIDGKANKTETVSKTDFDAIKAQNDDLKSRLGALEAQMKAISVEEKIRKDIIALGYQVTIFDVKIAKMPDGRTQVKVQTGLDNNDAWLIGDTLNEPRSHGKKVGNLIANDLSLTFESATRGWGSSTFGVATFYLK